MSKNKQKFPASIAKYNVYTAGERLLGISGTVDLPTLEFIKATLNGAGMGGSMDVSTPGQTNNIQITIPFVSASQEMFSLIRPGETTMLTLRGGFQELDAAGVTHMTPIRVVVRGTVGSIIRGIHLLEEIAELLLYLLQPGAFFGPFDGPAAQRIRNDRHLFSLRKQEGSNPVSVVIKVDESGLALFHLDLAGVAAILVRPDGIEHLDRRPFQTADGDLVIRHGALQGTPDGCLVAGNRQGGGEQPRQNYVKSFHML